MNRIIIIVTSAILWSACASNKIHPWVDDMKSNDTIHIDIYKAYNLKRPSQEFDISIRLHQYHSKMYASLWSNSDGRFMEKVALTHEKVKYLSDLEQKMNTQGPQYGQYNKMVWRKDTAIKTTLLTEYWQNNMYETLELYETLEQKYIGQIKKGKWYTSKNHNRTRPFKTDTLFMSPYRIAADSIYSAMKFNKDGELLWHEVQNGKREKLKRQRRRTERRYRWRIDVDRLVITSRYKGVGKQTRYQIIHMDDDALVMVLQRK